MKTPLISLALALAATAASAFAQGLTTKLEGFVDTPWGTAEDAVKKTFPKRTRARFDQIQSTPGKLFFNGGTFAKFKARKFVLEFVNARFWMGVVIIDPVSKDRMKEYAAFKQLLTEKYGAPSSDEVRGNNRVTNWHVGAGPEEKERIELQTNPAGEGLHVMYGSDRTRKSQQTAPPPVDAKKPKPVSAAPGAKDDL